MTTTLAEVLGPGRIPDLDDSDFRELVELTMEDAERRGYTITFAEPADVDPTEAALLTMALRDPAGLDAILARLDAILRVRT